MESKLNIDKSIPKLDKVESKKYHRIKISRKEQFHLSKKLIKSMNSKQLLPLVPLIFNKIILDEDKSITKQFENFINNYSVEKIPSQKSCFTNHSNSQVSTLHNSFDDDESFISIQCSDTSKIDNVTGKHEGDPINSISSYDKDFSPINTSSISFDSLFNNRSVSQSDDEKLLASFCNYANILNEKTCNFTADQAKNEFQNNNFLSLKTTEISNDIDRNEDIASSDMNTVILNMNYVNPLKNSVDCSASLKSNSPVSFQEVKVLNVAPFNSNHCLTLERNKLDKESFSRSTEDQFDEVNTTFASYTNILSDSTTSNNFQSSIKSFKSELASMKNLLPKVHDTLTVNIESCNDVLSNIGYNKENLYDNNQLMLISTDSKCKDLVNIVTISGSDNENMLNEECLSEFSNKTIKVEDKLKPYVNKYDVLKKPSNFTNKNFLNELSIFLNEHCGILFSSAVINKKSIEAKCNDFIKNINLDEIEDKSDDGKEKDSLLSSASKMKLDRKYSKSEKKPRYYHMPNRTGTLDVVKTCNNFSKPVSNGGKSKIKKEQNVGNKIILPTDCENRFPIDNEQTRRLGSISSKIFEGKFRRGWVCSYKYCQSFNLSNQPTCKKCLNPRFSYPPLCKRDILCVNCGYINYRSRLYCKKCKFLFVNPKLDKQFNYQEIID